mgnify:FL=1
MDPIGLRGGLNLYAYAPNPLNWIDPLGGDPLGLARKCISGFNNVDEAAKSASNKYNLISIFKNREYDGIL